MIFIHALAVMATVSLVRRERRLGRIGAGFRSDFAIVVVAILVMLSAHLIEIALWSAIFVLCGEFSQFGIAYYHSAVNYTTLGYGDVSGGWNGYVRCLDCDSLFCHSSDGSGSICGSQD
jgi:Ion channel